MEEASREAGVSGGVSGRTFEYRSNWRGGMSKVDLEAADVNLEKRFEEEGVA